MMRFLVKSRKRLISNVAVFASCVNFLSPSICYTQPVEDPNLLTFFDSKYDTSNEESSGYTVNFNNVPVIEVIRFVSKITNTNFVFNEADIQFNVSIISEEPITVKNIMSALIQVLRINQLTLLEQDNSLIITKSTDVNQIPTIVSGDIPSSEKTTAPLITRVFRIKNASVSSIANIIRPLTSKSAQIEVSNETRQLIVTDITTNVDKIGSLLASLDAPHTPLEIDSYEIKHIAASELVSLTTQILSPFTEGNPLIFVPQMETNTIFIVSTPYLIERAITVMEDIDIPSKINVIGQKASLNDSVFLYKIINKSPEELEESLREIASKLNEANPVGASNLVKALRSSVYIEDSNSLMFVADPESWTKIKEVLASVDTEYSPHGAMQLFVYKIKTASGPQILKSLQEMANTSKEEDFISTIESAKWVRESNTLVFNGPNAVIDKLQSILPTIDTQNALSAQAKGNFFIYAPKNLTGMELVKAVQDTTENLKNSGLSNSDLIDCLESMKWIPSTNSIIFTGDNPSIEAVKDILATLDVQSVTSGPTESFIYKPKYGSRDQITEALDKFSESLDPNDPSDRNLSKTIKNVSWLAETGTFIFKGNVDTIKRLQTLLSNIDNPQTLTGGIPRGFFIYKLQYASGDAIIDNLKKMASLLSSADTGSTPLIKAVDKVKWIKENNTLLLTGSNQEIEQIKEMIADFDVPSAQKTAGAQVKSQFFLYKPVHQTPSQLSESIKILAEDLKTSGLIDDELLETMTSGKVVSSSSSVLFTGTNQSIEKLKAVLDSVDIIPSGEANVQSIGKMSFVIYKIKKADPTTLMNSMKSFAVELSKSSGVDKEIADVINQSRYIKETNSILFTGPQEALAKAEHIAEKFDIAPPRQVERAPTENFLVYNPKYQSGQELITILEEFMHNLQTSGLSDPQLYDTITHLKFIDKTNSLVITGTADSIAKVEQLLTKFDIPSKDAAKPSISSIDKTNFLIYKLQYHKGNEIQNALKEISISLSKSVSASNEKIVQAIESIQWIKATNSLIGTGDPDILMRLRELIESIDIPLRQVFIEVLVIETSLLNSQSFGLQWGSQLQYLNRTVGAMGNFPIPAQQSLGDQAQLNIPNLATPLGNTTASNPPTQGGGSSTSIPFGNGFDLGVIGDIILHKGKSFLSLGSLLNALQVDNGTTVVMNPKIITQDGHTSTIFVGQNIPFTGSYVNNVTQGASSISTSNIEYRDVGVNLTITPTLGTNNVVTLDISQDITEQVPTSTNVSSTGSGTVTVNGIQTTHTSLNTRVHVPDSHFLVLSGMINDTKNNFRTGIPCLGGLPVVGALFSQNDRASIKQNVIIFLRPVIVDTFTDYDKVTEQEEAMFKENASIQQLKEEFDAGTEMIKALEK